jgi:hypothetical protein
MPHATLLKSRITRERKIREQRMRMYYVIYLYGTEEEAAYSQRTRTSELKPGQSQGSSIWQLASTGRQHANYNFQFIAELTSKTFEKSPTLSTITMSTA